MWDNNTLNGKGTMTLAGEAPYTGEFKDGEFVPINTVNDWMTAQQPMNPFDCNDCNYVWPGNACITKHGCEHSASSENCTQTLKGKWCEVSNAEEAAA